MGAFAPTFATEMSERSVMRVLFTTIAGTGHFNPLVPYAQEMQRRGHEVQVANAQRR